MAITNNKGFSLIEAIIATTVLSVGLLGLIGLFGAGYQALDGGDKRSIAAKLARDQMEVLRSRSMSRINPPMEDLPSGPPSEDHPEGQTLGMRRQWSILRSPDDAMMWVITVEVSWHGLKGQNKKITLKSLRSS
ncbi:MAG: prepilin-type N-terminal cleavage/methylation domain-containing protein [Nitrospirota bacterium]|nr:prepilin-type N-terminal cleavage/methylation domain-containing protein [Nitrospirota bacterium]